MKTIKVGTCLILQAVVSLLLPVFYFASFSVCRTGDQVIASVRFDLWLFMGLGLAAMLALWFLRRRRERTDEFARRAIGRADAVCFRAAMVFLCVILLPALLIFTVLRSTPPLTTGVIRAGQILVCGVSALFLLRAALFLRIEKKGMVD